VTLLLYHLTAEGSSAPRGPTVGSPCPFRWLPDPGDTIGVRTATVWRPKPWLRSGAWSAGGCKVAPSREAVRQPVGAAHRVRLLVPRGPWDGVKGVTKGSVRRDTLKSQSAQQIGRRVSRGSGRGQGCHWVSQGVKTTPPLVAPFRLPTPKHRGRLLFLPQGLVEADSSVCRPRDGSIGGQGGGAFGPLCVHPRNAIHLPPGALGAREIFRCAASALLRIFPGVSSGSGSSSSARTRFSCGCWQGAIYVAKWQTRSVGRRKPVREKGLAQAYWLPHGSKKWQCGKVTRWAFPGTSPRNGSSSWPLLDGGSGISDYLRKFPRWQGASATMLQMRAAGADLSGPRRFIAPAPEPAAAA
jgi:hypothetical protein